MPLQGTSPEEIVDLVARVGGIAALAHPGTLKRDDLIPRLAAAGLTAIEAYHSAHTADEQRHYVAMARRLNIGVSGGSDFHGPGTRRAEFFGRLTLPADAFDDLRERAARARS
jgi:predicted metal-dependent phosphoesterase TrpH